MRRVAPLVAGALVATVLLAATGGSHHGAPDPADAGPDGHASLVQALDQHGGVTLISSSLGALPRDAEGTLFLFPGHREATAWERWRIERWVADGGAIVMAGDGPGMQAWGDTFGIRIQPVAALAQDGACIDTLWHHDGSDVPLCLPDPAALPDVDQRLLAQALLPAEPVFLDADGDHRLTTGDQGPDRYILGTTVSHGAGRLHIIADGDLWRNDAAEEHPTHLDLALALADGGPAFIDASGGGHRSGLRTALLAATAPGGWSAIAATLAFLVAAATVASGPALRPWRPHVPSSPRDMALEDAVRARIARHFQKERT